jgi:hypothetical protein
MGLQNLLHKNNLNSFREGLALNSFPFKRFFKGFNRALHHRDLVASTLDGGCHQVGVLSITVAEPYGRDREQYIYEASRPCKR